MHTLYAEAHPTIIRIKQLKRSYSRRLKVIWPFTCINIITRRAYSLVDLAVNTSRPHYYNDPPKREAKLQKNLCNRSNPVTFVKNL